MEVVVGVRIILKQKGLYLHVKRIITVLFVPLLPRYLPPVLLRGSLCYCSCYIPFPWLNKGKTGRETVGLRMGYGSWRGVISFTCLIVGRRVHDLFWDWEKRLKRERESSAGPQCYDLLWSLASSRSLASACWVYSERSLDLNQESSHVGLPHRILCFTAPLLSGPLWDDFWMNTWAGDSSSTQQLPFHRVSL